MCLCEIYTLPTQTLYFDFIPLFDAYQPLLEFKVRHQQTASLFTRVTHCGYWKRSEGSRFLLNSLHRRTRLNDTHNVCLETWSRSPEVSVLSLVCPLNAVGQHRLAESSKKWGPVSHVVESTVPAKQTTLHHRSEACRRTTNSRYCMSPLDFITSTKGLTFSGVYLSVRLCKLAQRQMEKESQQSNA